MYDPTATFRKAGQQMEPLPAVDPRASALFLLQRLHKLLNDYVPGMNLEPARVRSALAQPLSQPGPDPLVEGERLFALGWAAWLEGDWDSAEAGLHEAWQSQQQDACTEPNPRARTAYWLARVRVLLERPESIAEYETILKRLGGSPQATAWYVDLLWRAGRSDRAEQVWKAVRANKRVLSCDEGPLLEARVALRRGELGLAERLLREANPRNGVVCVERDLLLAWSLATRGRADPAREVLARASQGPYPFRVLQQWQGLLEARLAGTPIPAVPLAAGWQAYLEGQQARTHGDREQALAHYEQARLLPAVQPFADYARRVLGVQDASFQEPPGAFFALRQRVWQALEQFLQRRLRPGELLEAIDQAARGGMEVTGLQPYRQLALWAQAGQMPLDQINDFLDEKYRRNILRLALEVAPCPILPLLQQQSTADLRQAAHRLQIRQALEQGDASRLPADAPEEMRALLEGGNPESILNRADIPGIQGLLLARTLVQAVARLDAEEVYRALQERACWTEFASRPPLFVLSALERFVLLKTPSSRGRKILADWLALWPQLSAASEGALLAATAGVWTRGAVTPVPAGVSPDAWFAHQAARALLDQNPVQAWSFLQGTTTEESSLRTALERLAQAQALAVVVSYARPQLLCDMVDLLRENCQGQALLEAAQRGDQSLVEEQLAELAQRPDLPGRLYHHLALVHLHLADQKAEQCPLAETRHAISSWDAWFRFFLSQEGPSKEQRQQLVEFLLDRERTRLTDHLAREADESAQAIWKRVLQLSELARTQAPAWQQEVTEAVQGFRERLVTDYLLATRERMRFGEVPEGWRLDYPAGLERFKRFLVLDPEEQRILTALVETCVEWFVDLYHLQDRRLLQEVERYTPEAERLAARVGSHQGEVMARASLSDFWKFRGFIAWERADKLALYREALRLNPGNENVRELLAELESENGRESV